MTREEVIAKANSFAKPVPFTDGDVSIHLRPLMAGERREAVAFQAVHGDDAGWQFLYVRSVCDADGKRLFTDDDAELVTTFPAALVNPVIERIVELNHMGGGEKKAPSIPTPTSNSLSG